MASRPQDIASRPAAAADVAESNPMMVSTSPTATFHSPPSSYNAYASFGGRAASGSFSSTGAAGDSRVVGNAKPLKPFNSTDIKILLLENVNESGRSILTGQGYQVEYLKSSLPEAELIEKIRDVHVIGIRSKTRLTEKVLAAAKNLLVVGCFCIGTNQVDLEYAAKNGIAVFNSPFANSRSVAELMIGWIISLARQLGDRSSEMHSGTWNKVSARCWEIRGKTLGIVGYGHIGSQLSVLAEAMGMSVIYYDIVTLMALGKARQVASLNELLREADFVTMHVPATPETRCMIGAAQLAQMKQGAYLLNASRGTVVDIPALVDALKSGKLAGAALDVYPQEPGANGAFFNGQLNPGWGDELRGLKNVILTPHIGGSTEEAQRAIGVEVGDALVRYINQGITLGSVNLPEVNMRSLTLDEPNHARVIYIHRNVPGVLRRVNEILGDHNVDKQITDSKGDIAYLMADVSDVKPSDLKEITDSLEALSSRILTRVLY
ncbi:MAG: D-3-phosphoglycerate dehydrogenase 2 [Sporothrix thermara]